MIHRVKGVKIVKERGIEWTRFKHSRGHSEFHAAKQRIEVECDFAVAIDMDALVQRLGQKAAFSKGQKSKLADGIIELRCLGRRVVKDERTPVSIPDGYVKAERVTTREAIAEMGDKP